MVRPAARPNHRSHGIELWGREQVVDAEDGCIGRDVPPGAVSGRRESVGIGSGKLLDVGMAGRTVEVAAENYRQVRLLKLLQGQGKLDGLVLGGEFKPP